MFRTFKGLPRLPNFERLCAICDFKNYIQEDVKHVCVKSDTDNEWFCKLGERYKHVESICFHVQPYKMSSILQSCHHLTFVDLCNIGLDFSDVDDIVAICKSNQLKYLDISCNELREGARVIFDYLTNVEKESLHYLSVKANGITKKEDWKAICLFIQKSNVLQTLKLDENRNVYIFPELAKSVQVNRSLKSLGTKYCFEIAANLNLMGCAVRDKFAFSWSSDSDTNNFMTYIEKIRNRLFSSKSVSKLLLDKLFAFNSLNLPFYLLIYLFDFTLYVDQFELIPSVSSFSSSLCVASFEAIESHLRFKKAKWLEQYRRSLQQIRV